MSVIFVKLAEETPGWQPAVPVLVTGLGISVVMWKEIYYGEALFFQVNRAFSLQKVRYKDL